MSRKHPVEMPHDGYAAIAALYPESEVDVFEILESPAATAEVLVSLPIPAGVNRRELSRLRFEFNMAGVHAGKFAQRSIFNEMLGLIPDLGNADLFPLQQSA